MPRTPRATEAQGDDVTPRRVCVLCVLCRPWWRVATRTRKRAPDGRRRRRSSNARACAPATPRASRCKVSLPEGLHTQSNKPRDPLLIPTELTIDAPAGVTVEGNRVSAVDRSEAGRAGSAARGVRADVRDRRAAGDRDRRAGRRRRRSRSTCAIRRATRTSATRRRRPTASGRSTSCRQRKPAAATSDPIFGTIAFGKGEAPDAAPPARRPQRHVRQPAARSGDGIAKLDQFTDARHERRLPQRRRVPALRPQRRERREGTRHVRRPRAADDPAARAASAASR